MRCRACVLGAERDALHLSAGTFKTSRGVADRGFQTISLLFATLATARPSGE